MRVNIVGLGLGWEDCPTGNGLVWGINELITRRPVHTTFDMHDVPAILSGEVIQKRRSLKKLQEQIKKVRESKTVMYSLDTWGGLPCTKYPIRAIVDRFGSSYFTGTVDYALAFALWKGYFTSIHLYGVNYSTAWEYKHQLPGAAYWLGRAHEMDIKVVVHGLTSKLLKTNNGLVYGYNIKQKDFFSLI